MKNLVLSSLLFICSCASYSDSFVEKQKSTASFSPPYLLDFNEETYKISIDAYGNQFGGILVAKKLDFNYFRFAFLNEFGGKMLDFELNQGELKLNYALEQLNKKVILNLLKKDFYLLFSEQNSIEREFTGLHCSILESTSSKLKQPVFYFINSDTQNLDSIILAKRKEKVKIIFDKPDEKDTQIVLTHGKLPIKISLHLLDNKHP